LLLSLTLRSDERQRSSAAEQLHEPKSSQFPDVQDGTPTSTSCALCQATFPSVHEQRQHVRSDFHRYNLKLKLKGSQPVNESTFTKLVGDLDESLSGSDSSESEEEEADGVKNGDTTLTALLKRQARISQIEEGDGFATSRRKHGAGNAPLLWMSSSKLPQNTALGVYKALLTDAEQEEAKAHLVDVVTQKQLKPAQAKQSGSAQSNGDRTPAASSPHVFLCMIGGGHFAAMIVALAPEVRKGQGGVEERHAIVKAHKTFHRYTTRRKQGGSQSANDNAKGNAHSAGSSIRRYNEAALELDVRSVFSEWKSMIDTAELLFIRATGTTNRRTLFGPYDGQVLHKYDKRIRGFPFSTRRATQAELMRSFTELTKLKVSMLTESAIEASAGDQNVSVTPAKAPTASRPAPPKLSKEEEAAILHTSQLQALTRRSKAQGLLIYLTKNSLSPNYAFYPLSEHHHAPTPLHLAASTNSPALVIALLTKANADPTILSGDSKTAYDIAGDMRTRDAFRVARDMLAGSSDSSIDWNAAHVPSPMTQEEADGRAVRDKAMEDAAEADRRKSDLERIRKEEEELKVGKIQRKAGVGKGLSILEKTAEERRQEEARGLMPEMRARLERERRARAAEERIWRMQDGGR
jgi:hypothetical protein